MVKTLLKIVLFFFLSTTICKAQNLYINEIITSNSSIITDEDGSYEDWIELFYNGAQPLNLSGYGLSDNPSLLYKWTFPAYWIQPGEHLLIWCSNKNRIDTAAPLHTNFAISAGGETITLTHPEGNIIDQIPEIIIPQNYSYGRSPSGSTTFSIFSTPTPGLVNASEGVSTPLNPPSFSVNSGFYDTGFSLTITHPDPEVTILYSLDGSEPKQENLAGKSYLYKNQYEEFPGQESGELLEESYATLNYNAPIEIADRSELPNKLASISSTLHQTPYYFPINPIFKGTVVRAKAVKEGFISSETVTSTYFISPEESDRYSLPVVSISLDEDSFFDYENGIYVAGKDFDDWRMENPELIGDFNANANYNRSGDDTEMKGNFSYFVDGNQVVNQDLGIRINGGSTRSLPNKSLRLYARSEYGNSTFDHPFFANLSDSSFKRLILRNSGNDAFLTCFRDGFIQNAVSHLNFDTQAYQPTVVFLNSEYWGILNLRERFDKHYFERVYGIDETELDYLESSGYVIKEGDNNHYLSMLNFIENNSLTQDENYDYVATQLDPDNFIDYFATEIYIRNTDWPGNNIEFFRKKTDSFEPSAPLGHDGRWRWILKDTDFGFGGEGGDLAYTHNTLEFATQENGPDWPNPEWSTFLLRNLLENQNFKNQFINRFADLMNTTFKPERLLIMIDQMQNNLAPEINEHIQRWNHIGSVQQWNINVNVMKQFANQRTNYQRNHIREKFNIDENITVYLNVSDDTHGLIKINTIDITPTTPGVAENPYPWTGVYFKNIPIKVKAIANSGFEFSHWSGDSTSLEEEITITPTGNIQLTAHFVPTGTIAEEIPLYFWLFDNTVANDTALTEINSSFEIPMQGVLSFQSCLVGYPFDSLHPNWRKASMERRNSPTEINYIPEANNDILFGDSNMRGIQIKQPFQNDGLENQMIFEVSTLGYQDILFGFTAKNEGAADTILIDYCVSQGEPTWMNTGLNNPTLTLSDEFQLFEVDFENLVASNNNSNFKIRLRFGGQNLTLDNGDRVTFNNFSLKGSVFLELPENNTLQFNVYPNPVANDVYISHNYQSVTYNLFSIDGKLIKEGLLVDRQIYMGDMQQGIYILKLTAKNKSVVKKIIKK